MKGYKWVKKYRLTPLGHQMIEYMKETGQYDEEGELKK